LANERTTAAATITTNVKRMVSYLDQKTVVNRVSELAKDQVSIL